MNQPKPTAHFLIISAPKLRDQLMIAADLFEQGKHLGYLEHVTTTYKPRTRLTLMRAGRAINHLRDAYQSREQLVTLVHLLRVDRGHITEHNHGIVKPWWNPEVRIVSTGHKWYMLDDFMRLLRIPVTTNEFRYVTGVD